MYKFLLYSVLSLSATAFVAYRAVGQMTIRVEKDGRHIISAKTSLSGRCIAQATTVYKDAGGKQIDLKEWTHVEILTLDKQGKPIPSSVSPSLGYLKHTGDATIYIPKRKMTGPAYGPTEAPNPISILMQTSNFISFAQSERATIIVPKRKVVFTKASLKAFEAMADKIQRNLAETQ